jgi:serpin B
VSRQSPAYGIIEAMLKRPHWRRTASVALIVVVLAAIAAGCGPATAANGPRGASKPAAGKPSAPASTLLPGRATEAFELALMHRLGQGNLVFSPDSVAAALAMIGTGGVGPTATQIAHVLHLQSPASFQSMGQLQQRIASEQSAAAHGSSEAPKLSIVNGLFLQRGYPLQAPFTTSLQQAFGVVPQTVDFMSASGTEAINSWVAQETQGLIPKIVTELSPETRLALANAIYLKAKWSERFKPNNSNSATFHGETGKSSTVFMHKIERLPYTRGHGYAALSLPYLDSTLSLLVLLPVGQSLPTFERHLDTTKLDRIVRALSRRNVYVSLPRFHLHTQTLLNGPLQQLGITDAFDEAHADFSGMTQSERLKIGEVAHAADFKVDEEGTVAAAATVGTAEATSATIYEHPVAFNANRPFMFFLRDDRSGAVLFAGRLVKPQD